MRAIGTRLVFASLGLCFASGACGQAQTYGEPPTPKVVAYVIKSLQQGDLASAAALVGQYRRLNGDTPESLDALSWLARGELAAGHIREAVADADEVERKSQAALATRNLDAEPYLPIALGAAFEVKAQALIAEGKRADAIQLLETDLRAWHGTSIANRLQKNINLLTLEGKPMPPLREAEWIGPKPATVASLRGKVVLFFFWAHWCADCKADAPVLAQVAKDFAPRGLVVVAPTRRYGYTAQEEHATAAEETPFIDKVYAKYYSGIPNLGVPLDTGNFERFGVSTTPTIVIVDRRGIVKLYHPGLMTDAELRQVIEPLLSGRSTS